MTPQQRKNINRGRRRIIEAAVWAKLGWTLPAGYYCKKLNHGE